FFTYTATTPIYSLSLHDALPICRTVTIKVVPDAVARDPERRQRLLSDARAAAALSHPNIAALYEVGEDQDRLFLVFEFVPGETRSEEHTSELQSRGHLVCRLLLE